VLFSGYDSNIKLVIPWWWKVQIVIGSPPPWLVLRTVISTSFLRVFESATRYNATADRMGKGSNVQKKKQAQERNAAKAGKSEEERKAAREKSA